MHNKHTGPKNNFVYLFFSFGRLSHPPRPLVFLYLVSLSLFFSSFSRSSFFVDGEVLRWRYPGLSGRWLDPHNWRGETSGLPRIPGPNDDVILGGTYDWPLSASQMITLEARGTITVKSLTMNNCVTLSAPCADSTVRYYYDLANSEWKNITLLGSSLNYCGIALLIVPQTTLNVQGDLNMASRAQLILASSASDPTLKATVKAGNWLFKGEIYGAGDIYGDLNFADDFAKIDMIRFYSNGNIEPANSKKSTTVTIYGNINVTQGNLGFYLDYISNTHSTLEVKGTISFPAKQFTVWTNGAYSSMTPYSNLIIFDNSTNPSPPNWAYYQPYLGRTQLDFLCNGFDGTTTNNGGGCGSVSAHAFNSLLDFSSGSTCCPEGFTGLSCNIPYCPGVPVCNSRGTCNSGLCICQSGWTGFACELPLCPGKPRECSANGECYAPLPLGSAKPYCRCREGWGGADCSQPLCPNNCTSPLNGNCNTQGNSPKCVCKVGWQPGPLLDCSVRATYCPGQTLECSGNGICSNGTCNCYTGWQGADCSLAACPSGCNHHGKCVKVSGGGTGTKCQCDAGWSGSDCSLTACNNGAGCSGHGYCSPDLDPPRCICNGPTVLPTIAPPSPAVPNDYGWGGPACSIGFLPECSATNCTANGGTCGGINTGYQCLRSTCPSGWTGWDCSEPICVNTGYPECNGHGNCKVIGGTPQCVCRPGYVLGDDNSCAKAACEIGIGPNNTICNGHGKCRTDLAVPTCECDPFFYGDDCSNTTCPGYLEPCSGNGACFTNGTCNCTEHWQGADCSIPICPRSALSNINCNHNGFCNSSSFPFFCQCYQGWVGTTCDKAICPNNCSDNGYCDESLSPPACRCDAFHSGDDCSVVGGDGSDSSDNIMGVIIGATVAGMVGVILIGAAIGLAGYIVYRVWKLKKYRDGFGNPSGASVNF